jgi:F0F1-type ATP synthase epsilon subunit
MKPTKNRVLCKDCGKYKMLFESEKKANTFIKFNGNEIEAESGYKPERSYYCIYCGGWHLTSQKEYIEIKSKTEILLEKYNEEKERKAKLLQEEKLITEKKQRELKKMIASLEKDVNKLQLLDTNSINLEIALQTVANKLEKIKEYKKYSFKGSNKRIKDVQEKIMIIKCKIA